MLPPFLRHLIHIVYSVLSINVLKELNNNNSAFQFQYQTWSFKLAWIHYSLNLALILQPPKQFKKCVSIIGFLALTFGVGEYLAVCYNPDFIYMYQSQYLADYTTDFTEGDGYQSDYHLGYQDTSHTTTFDEDDKLQLTWFTLTAPTIFIIIEELFSSKHGGVISLDELKLGFIFFNLMWPLLEPLNWYDDIVPVTLLLFGFAFVVLPLFGFVGVFSFRNKARINDVKKHYVMTYVQK
ncbi:unnamed protein product [Ambrosiozyma monospora]|uniref:Unnamed protein product n=1 Tax=Ambrosiozyma monospora TaxID=43982 RepID=A0A9W6SVC9_AMBMO|nr:unnamed protein product [Ambrosiozyma monospora]